ncbi:MAG TPA: hypothetical protein VNF99_02480 [Stellaceae bacterium]|nr:hypothetical protein [Stellaceae bacterium]
MPAALVPEVPSPVRIDTEGLASVDIKIVDGRIAGFSDQAIADGLPFCDLEDGQAWPCFVDLHTHLDKGHIVLRGGKVIDTMLPDYRELDSLFA